MHYDHYQYRFHVHAQSDAVIVLVHFWHFVIIIILFFITVIVCHDINCQIVNAFIVAIAVAIVVAMPGQTLYVQQIAALCSKMLDRHVPSFVRVVPAMHLLPSRNLCYDCYHHYCCLCLHQ